MVTKQMSRILETHGAETYDAHMPCKCGLSSVWCYGLITRVEPWNEESRLQGGGSRSWYLACVSFFLGPASGDDRIENGSWVRH